MKLFIYGFLIVGLLCSQSLASDTDVIYYHWLSPNKVFLWKSTKDSVGVVAERRGNSWQLYPDNIPIDKEWESLLRIALTGNMPSSDSLWPIFLQRLYEHTIDKKMLRTRFPDTEIYFRIVSGDNVIISFINSRFGLLSYSFSKSEDIFKKPRSQSIEPRQVLLLSESAPEFFKIFEITKAPHLEDWVQMWDKWIKNNLRAVSPIKPLMYFDSTGTNQWLWMETLTEANWTQRLSRPMSPPPKIERIPIVQSECNLLAIVPVLAVGLFVGASALWVYYFWHRNRKMKEASKGKAGPPQPQPGQSFSIDKLLLQAMTNVLNALQEEVARGYRRQQSTQAQLHVLMLQWVNEEYKKSLEKNALQFLEPFNQYIENEKGLLVDRFGLKGKSADDVKRLLDVGDRAEAAFRKIKASSHQNVEATNIMAQAYLTTTDWYAKLPSTWELLGVELTNANEKAKRLQSEKTTLEKEKRDFEAKLSSIETELEKETKEAAQLKTRIADAQKANTELQKKVTAVSELDKWAIYLNQGQRNFLDSKNDKPSAAILSFLINYSLSRISIAIVQGQEVRRNAMLANIYSISKKLERYEGFKFFLRNFPEGTGITTSVPAELEKPHADHADEKIFMLLIKYLRELSSINLAPFYFGGEEGKSLSIAI